MRRAGDGKYLIFRDAAGREHSIRCLRCGLTSFHPDDVKNRYCGHCHIFHEGLANR